MCRGRALEKSHETFTSEYQHWCCKIVPWHWTECRNSSIKLVVILFDYVLCFFRCTLPFSAWCVQICNLHRTQSPNLQDPRVAEFFQSLVQLSRSLPKSRWMKSSFCTGAEICYVWLCVCVCVCVCVYIRVSVCRCVWFTAYVHVCVHVNVHRCVCITREREREQKCER